MIRAAITHVSPSRIAGELILVVGSAAGSSAYGAVCALAVERRQEIHRVDFERVIGKSSGETEKKLDRLLSPLKSEVGFCSSTKLTPFSVNARMCAMPMTATPTSR